MEQNTLTKKYVLHVGCGQYNPEKLHSTFKGGEWQEVRFDIEESVKPDIVGDMLDMHVIAENSFDAIFSSHNLEHVYDYQVPTALKEFYRVIKEGGFLLITLPNIQVLGEFITKGNLDAVVYESPAGPITTVDILFGHGPSLKNGFESMAHKTAFTPDRLKTFLLQAGFKNIELVVSPNKLYIWAKAYK